MRPRNPSKNWNDKAVSFGKPPGAPGSCSYRVECLGAWWDWTNRTFFRCSSSCSGCFECVSLTGLEQKLWHPNWTIPPCTPTMRICVTPVRPAPRIIWSTWVPREMLFEFRLIICRQRPRNNIEVSRPVRIYRYMQFLYKF